MKKRLLIAAATAVVGLSTIGGLGIASAETASTTTSSDPMSSLVQKIATKFNLKQADVQSVFDENKAAMDATREKNIVTEQAQLVKDGTLTQAQSDAITAKRAALQKEMEASRTTDQSKTDAERKTAMEARKTAIDTWLKDQGIDSKYTYLLMGRGHGGHMGDRGQKDSSSTTSTTN